GKRLSRRQECQELLWRLLHAQHAREMYDFNIGLVRVRKDEVGDRAQSAGASVSLQIGLADRLSGYLSGHGAA
ncbi:hypothetical protein PHISCL_11167, partial [Aspergillus sclerotialis]